MINPDSSQELDEQLSRFTDALLDGDSPGDQEMMAHIQELPALQETVSDLQRVFGQKQPGAEMSARIKATLIAEWQKARRPWWQQAVPHAQKKTVKQAKWRRPLFGLALAGATLLIVFALPSLAISSGSPVTGSAGTGDILPLALIGALVGGGLLVWLARQNK